MSRRLGLFSRERAISPVVGGALLVAIVVLLATVTGAIVFGIADDEPPAPTARLRLEPTGSCQFELTHRGGDRLDGDRITVQGLDDPDALAGERLAAEDAVAVDPTESTVRVVWSAPDGDTDHVLRTFEVDPSVTSGWACTSGTVLTSDASGHITVLRPGENPIELSATSSLDALGTADVDVTGDGRSDVPYVTTGDAIAITNGTNETTTLATSSDISGTIEGAKTRVTAAAWNGNTPSVYFVDENHDTIYRVAPGESPTVVASPSDGAQAVLGPGDVDGDGDRELLFADGSQQLRYVEPSGGVEKVDNGQTGSNNGIGSGSVADFDDDGVVTVVTIDGSNDLKVVGEPTAQGGEGKTTIPSVDAAKAPVTIADVDGDASSEVVYVSTSGYLKYVDDVYGSQTVSFVRDADGDKVDADDATGVV
ncbi:type IV pilin N-terminal domain-containing protein [Halorubellus litoreus]|uniref:Type IV pilin N-terminal domain-containing protein n=1 Tax=Halorubellus litoreus TaxID=755308 RepID=A0ABD5VFS1_9EURY